MISMTDAKIDPRSHLIRPTRRPGIRKRRRGLLRGGNDRVEEDPILELFRQIYVTLYSHILYLLIVGYLQMNNVWQDLFRLIYGSFPFPTIRPRVSPDRSRTWYTFDNAYIYYPEGIMPRGENLRIARDAYVRAFPRLLVSMRMIDEAGNELPDANYYINLRHPRRRDEAPRTNETKRSQWIVDGEYRYIEINWECALWWTRTAFWLYVPLNQNANGQNIVQHRRVRLGARKVFLRPHVTVLHRELLEENYNAVNCVYFFDVHWWAFNIPLEAPVEPEARIRMYLRWPNPQDSAPVSPGKRHTVPGTQVTEKRSVTTGHASSGVAVNCSVEYRSNHVSTQTTVTMCGMP